MNYKQKLRYSVLGSVLTLVGMGLGAFLPTPLIAQDSRIFKRIICSEFFIVDNEGRPGVLMTTTPRGSSFISMKNAASDESETSIDLTASALGGGYIAVGNPLNKEVFKLDTSSYSTTLDTNNPSGDKGLTFEAAALKSLDLYGHNGNEAISLYSASLRGGAGITFKDATGTERIAIGYPNDIKIYNNVRTTGNRSLSRMVWQAPAK